METPTSTPPPIVPRSSTPPAPIEPGPPRGGCARGGLIGCGVAALLVLALLGGFAAYVRRKPEALTDWIMRRVESGYASDVTTSEKERLQSAYAKFRVRLQERRVPRGDLERLRTIMSSAAMGTISRGDVRNLTELFEGGEPPRPTPEGPRGASPYPTPPVPPTP
ncbi:MAG TPA: hypothetical protein VIA45_13925 [Thermoanaerobaculia bacterium]